MPFQHKPNQLSLFRNTRKQDENSPDHTGSGLISGSELGMDYDDSEVEVQVSAWINETKDGTKYFNIKLRKKKEQGFSPDTAGPDKADSDKEDSDIPF